MLGQPVRAPFSLVCSQNIPGIFYRSPFLIPSSKDLLQWPSLQVSPPSLGIFICCLGSFGLSRIALSYSFFEALFLRSFSVEPSCLVQAFIWSSLELFGSFVSSFLIVVFRCLEEEAEAEESNPDYEEGQEEDFEEGKSQSH